MKSKNDTSMVVVTGEKFAIDRAESKGYRNRIKISGSTGNEYIVSQRVSDNEWRCSCFGARGEKICKHLRAMLPDLQLIDQSGSAERKRLK